MIKFIALFFTCAYFIPFALVMMKNGISVGTSVPLLLSLSFYTGALPYLMASRNPARRAVAPAYMVYEDRIKILALSLLSMYVILRFFFMIKIFSQGGFFAIFSIMQSASQVRYEYGSSESTSLVFQLGSIFYFCLMGAIGSIIAPKFRLSWILVAAVLVLIEMMEGSRARALIGITLLLAEYVLARNPSLLCKSLRSYLLSFAGFFIIAAIIFLIPQYARIYNLDNALEIIFLNKLPSYTMAIYEALTVWAGERDLFSLDYGYNTFSGALKIFGFTFPQGFYEFSQTSFGPTNVYTNMRNILSDFGIIFSMVFYFFIGHAIGTASLKRAGLFSLMLVKLAVIFVLFPIYSPFIFANVVVGVLLLLFFGTVSSRYKIKL